MVGPGRLVGGAPKGPAEPGADYLELLLLCVTGPKKMDGGALIEYFAPLAKWLDEQNAGKKCGW